MTDVTSASDQHFPLLHKRILLKLSGEALMGERPSGLDPQTVSRIAGDIKEALALGVEMAIVVGGGNIFRGIQGAAEGMEQARADHMGMLATVMNGLALEQALEQQGIAARMLSAIAMPSLCEPFSRARALRHLAKGRVVILTAGTGHPFFTTDTAAALRAIEMKCEVLVKATQVDGVYSADPKVNPDAERYEELSYGEVLAKDLKVMDGAAIAIARDHNLPILIFSIWREGNLSDLLQGRARRTLIHN